jgi:hypothetical protein
MAKEVLKVICKEPLIKSDELGFTLDVSHTAFKKTPKRVYEVPNTAFWKKEAISDKGRYFIATGVIETGPENKPVTAGSAASKEGGRG